MAFYKVPMSGRYHDLERARSILQDHNLVVDLLPREHASTPVRRRANEQEGVAYDAVEVVLVVLTVLGNLASVVSAVTAVRDRLPHVQIGDPEPDDKKEENKD
jgi:DNA-directed RNA polymerase subunit H (RpoH/RPB5)